MFFIGVDLGQRQDYTAIAIVEKEELDWANLTQVYMTRKPAAPKMMVRRAQRIALGTPYPRVVETIREITLEPALAGRCTLVVDRTGVGAPVVDMLRAAEIPCVITAVTITSGDEESGRGSRNVGVPRRDLIEGVQLAIEKGELKIAQRMKEAGTLVRELIAMRSGGSDGGEHDDLVFAVALACWKARARKSVFGGGRLPGY